MRKTHEEVCGDAEKVRQKNWLQVVTIVVAFSGGIPGILGTVNYLRSKPIFGFQLDGVLRGTLPADDTPFLALFGTVTNQGEKPLNPRKFDLKIRFNSKWVSLDSLSFPEKMEYVFNSETQRITINNFGKMNLQEWNEPILVGQPARGCLVFYSKEFPQLLRDTDTITFQLTCLDIFNKKYAVTHTHTFGGDLQEPVKMLKYDITVGPNN